MTQKMRKILAALVFTLMPALSQAQTYLPFFANYGYTPTPAQWVQAWQSKQDVLNYTPLNIAGGAMTGRLIFSPSNAYAASINIPQGSAPSSPQNGDMWITTSGLYAQINNGTVGPFVASLVLTGDVTNSGSTVTLATVNSAPGVIGGVGAVPVMVINNKGLVTSQYTVSDMVGFRNRLINADARLSGYGGGAIAATVACTTVCSYFDERWFVNSYTGTATAQRVTVGALGFAYGLQITGGTSVTQAYIAQRVEATNIADQAGLTDSLQAVIYCSTAQTVLWAAYSPTAADNYTSSTLIASGSFIVSTTPGKFTTQIAMGANVANGVEIRLYPNNGGGFTSGTCTFTGVQLEPGATATQFEFRSIGAEKVLAQRYFQTYSVGAWAQFALAFSSTTSNVVAVMPFAVFMRSAPSSVTFSTASNFQFCSSVSCYTATAMSLISAANASVNFSLTTTVPTAGVPGTIRDAGSGGAVINISAEL